MGRFLKHHHTPVSEVFNLSQHPGSINLCSLKTLRREWGLIPTMICSAIALGMCGAYVAHMATQKTDLTWRPSSWTKRGAPYQSVKPNEIRRFMGHQNPQPKDPQIEALKRELGDYSRH